MRSTFASGLNTPTGLAFDKSGNLFVAADAESGVVYKFTPAGMRTAFASGLPYPDSLAFDRAGNLFVAATGANIVLNGTNIYKFTPTGVRTIFASGLTFPVALAFDSAGNLFVADGGTGYDIIVGAAVYKFTPSGVRSTVASQNDQVPVFPNGLAIDGADNLFVSNGGSILKFTPSGVRTTFAARSVTVMAFQPNAAPASRLVNFSTRGFVQTGNKVLIGGFIVTGAGPKQVILRALGPTLGQQPFNVPNALANTVLELYDANNVLIASNDN